MRHVCVSFAQGSMNDYLSEDIGPATTVYILPPHTAFSTISANRFVFAPLLRLVVLTVLWRAPLDKDAISCSARTYLLRTSLSCFFRACIDSGSPLPQRTRSCGVTQTSCSLAAGPGISSLADPDSERRPSRVAKCGSCVPFRRYGVVVGVERLPLAE